MNEETELWHVHIKVTVNENKAHGCLSLVCDVDKRKCLQRFVCGDSSNLLGKKTLHHFTEVSELRSFSRRPKI